MANGLMADLRTVPARALHVLTRIDTGLARAETGAGFAILTTLIAVLTLQVAGRQLPGLFFPWTEEVSRFLFVWLAFLGTALAVQRNAHVAIHVFADRTGPGVQLVLGLITRSLVVGFALIMVYYGLRLCMTTRMVSTVLRLPMWLPYAAIPVAGMLIVFHGLIGMLRLLADAYDRQKSSEVAQ